MHNTITVKSGLTAHFNQPTGPSRLGTDWAVRIEGVVNGVVLVRTYYSSEHPTEAEKQALADKAAALVAEKLNTGWTPQPAGTHLEVE